MSDVIYNYILEILKEDSFSKAANNLYISQSSLSRSIINYENKLNIKIFDKSNKTIKLTLAGEKVLTYLEESLQLEDELHTELKLITSNYCHNNSINIGIISWTVPIFLPKIVPEFNRVYPNIKSNLTINDSVTLENLVTNDILDVAIINGPIKNKNLNSVELYTSKLVLIASNEVSYKSITEENYTDASAVINLKDIKNEHFILLREETRLGRLTRNILAQSNVTPNNIIDVDNLNSAINIAYVNIGFTFIPRYLVSRGLIDTDKVKVFTIDNMDYYLPIVVAFKEEIMKCSNIQTFIEFVCANYRIKD